MSSENGIKQQNKETDDKIPKRISLIRAFFEQTLNRIKAAIENGLAKGISHRGLSGKRNQCIQLIHYTAYGAENLDFSKQHTASKIGIDDGVKLVEDGMKIADPRKLDEYNKQQDKEDFYGSR